MSAPQPPSDTVVPKVTDVIDPSEELPDAGVVSDIDGDATVDEADVADEANEEDDDEFYYRGKTRVEFVGAALRGRPFSFIISPQ